MKPDDNEIRFDIVPYFHGAVLDISEGRSKAFPHFISHLDNRVTEPWKLSMFSGQSFDAIVSSNVIHLLGEEDCIKTLREWSRVIKTQGHIVLHLPSEEVKASKWIPDYEKVVSLMGSLQRGWDCVDYQKRKDGSLLFAFKFLQKRGNEFSWKNEKPAKTCAVVRLGAFGDNVIASSILPWLKSQNYHVTFYTSDHGYPVIQHDPHIDRFIIQGRDEMPPQILGEFWKYEAKKYDKWVNLSESVEATLLAANDRTNHGWPNSVRAKYMDVNYLEFTHEIAEVPPPYLAKFYSTPDEKALARKQKFGRKNILWSLSGSSVHKTWPWLDNIVARLMIEYKDVDVVMVGDEVSQVLEAGWQKEPRVHLRSGKWSIRESMAFAEVADLIIGSETGLLNAAGMMETPKIVTLSHSSENMLCKHWKNYIALRQTTGCPIQPCRMLHTDWTYCRKHEETGTALCQAGIDTEQMWEAIVKFIGVPQRMVA